ncbi:aromatic alcohol reductase [Pedobacter hartonius]|uniref:NmrA-like family protein n=1 Tax=Pedobacter hartonius TaxID=425514 RepID=A0A1H4CSS5_9SPHI|nr:aromatic alcohol reductase [Pedobacter hartonius]SEA63460.1 NmrA-like family protein [Pedobacter hartonius]
MEKSFLVIGTGEVGLAMLNSLYDQQEKLGRPLTIGVLVQPVSSFIDELHANKRYAGIRIEAVDLVKESNETLASVFGRYDTVICCSGFSIGAGMQVKITQAVLAAGVRKYIPWQFGADYDRIGRGSAQPVFDEQLEVRDMLRAQQKTHWVIVSTGMITSFLFREDFGVISLKDRMVRALGDWQHSLTLTACEDIGALTVAILFHDPEVLDEVVFVAGDTVSFEEIGKLMDLLFGGEFKKTLWDVPHLHKKLEEEPHDVFNRYRLVFTHPGVTWSMDETFNYQNKIPTVGLSQWAKENLSGTVA